MSEDMSERMSKDVSEKMLEDMLEWNVKTRAYDSQIPGLPMFKRGIQMDIASAYRMSFTGRVPRKRATLKQL